MTMVEIDSPCYGRVLSELVIKRDVDTDEGELVYFSGLLAEEGYLFPCFKYGIRDCVKESMEIARKHGKGMFRLPDETRQPGCLPWDIKDGNTASEPIQIRNVNIDQPEALWFGKAGTDSTGDSSSDRYYVELAESKEWLEASCFVKKSTIPGAGLGLFLKPHPPIPKGQFVCLYATHYTTQEAMDATGSSSDYAILTGKAKLWFDAEKQDGVCLGRFANQLHVRESLAEVRERSRKSLFPEMREEDWKQINDADAQRANLAYEQRKEQLVLVTAKDLPRERKRPTSYLPTTATCVNTGFHLFDASQAASQIINPLSQSFTALWRVFHFLIFRFSSPGVFESDNIDEELTRAIEEKSHSPVIGSKRKRAMPKVGSGKGSPLKPRKVHVSRRQQRVQEKRGFDLSEFGRDRRVMHQKDQASMSTAGDKTSNESTSPPPETPPPTAQETPPPTAQETTASPPVLQTSSPTPLSPAAPAAAETPIPFSAGPYKRGTCTVYGTVYDFADSYLRFGACYVDENTTIRFSETISPNSYR
jgi:hypothetical protein